MGAPKSVIKIKKDGVHYESEVDKCEYYLHELTRAALRDVGKFIAKTFKTSFYSHFKRNTGGAGRATKYKVWSNAKTKYPRVDIGLKTGQVDGFYAYFQEFGTSKTPRLGLLQKAAKDNIDEIIKIESQYLSALSKDESTAKSLIDETEYEGDANG